jgi:hypothetical protein
MFINITIIAMLHRELGEVDAAPVNDPILVVLVRERTISILQEFIIQIVRYNHIIFSILKI